MRDGRLYRFGPYVVATLVAAVAAIAALRPWQYSATDLAFEAGDPLWVQAMLTVHGQAGPFGVADHLAFPVGATPWALPQLGILLGVFAWFTVGVLGMPVAGATTWWVVCSAAANAAAMLYFLRSVTRRFTVLAVTLAVTLSASVWILQRWGTANLALFVVLPLALGVIIRWPDVSNRYRWIGVATLAVVTAVSPLWWVVAAFMLLPFVWLAPLVRRQWPDLRAGVAVWLAVLAGLVVQMGLYAVAAGPMSDGNRSAWDSRWGGGTLVDFGLASPLLNWLVPRLELLRGGAGFDITWGFATAATAAVAVVLLLVIPPRRLAGASGIRVLTSTTTASLLFLLIGGLGTLQAGVAVLLGSASPARWWSRMLLVLAIVGAAWLLALLAHWRESRKVRDVDGPEFRAPQVVAYVIAAVAALSWVGDVVTHPNLVALGPAAKEQEVVGFLRSQSPACQVAQLPVEAVPTSRVEYNILDQQTYRPLAMYVLAPEYTWTAGSYTDGATDTVNRLPTDVTADDLAALRSDGYCAVVFNNTLADMAEKQGVDLQGRSISGVEPDFENEKYRVYLL